MLFTKTANPAALELLSSLMMVPLFREMRLAGGTAPALQIGHRRSIDLDLFGKASFENAEIGKVASAYGDFTWLNNSKNI